MNKQKPKSPWEDEGKPTARERKEERRKILSNYNKSFDSALGRQARKQAKNKRLRFLGKKKKRRR